MPKPEVELRNWTTCRKQYPCP